MNIENAIKALKDNRDKAPYLSNWKHLKSGDDYAVKGHVLLESSLDPHVIYYQRFADPTITWCRPASEFFDGRFEMQKAWQ